MPKVKKYEPPRIQREKALLKAIESCKVDKGIRRDTELSAYLGIQAYTYSRHKKNSFARLDWQTLADWLHKLGATAEDWCAIGGFSYERGGQRDD